MNVVSKLRQNSVVDLFSGAGGLSSAFERSGFHTVSAVDLDADCLSTLRATQQARLRIGKTQKKFLDGTKLLRADIRDVRRADLIPDDAGKDWRPDVLAGGPPCQPFSSAGAGRGLDDPRGQLFKHFVRLAGELRPRVVLFENVAGLVTAKGSNGEPGGVLEMIQQHFEGIGYACRFELLNAADFGAAQRRVRLYMIATCEQALPKFPKATHALNGLDGSLPWTSLAQHLMSLPEPCPSDIVRPEGKRAHELVALLPGTGLKSNGIVEANRPSGHWGYRQDCFVADLNAPSRTIRAASTPDWIQTPDGLRRLTWLECAALQGFPDGWLFEGGRGSRFRQIGNAVQGHIGQAIAHVIKGSLDSVLKETPVSAAWPAAFHKRVRYTAMEARVNGAHRTAARELRAQSLQPAHAAA